MTTLNRYVNLDRGQIHLRDAAAEQASGRPALVCLHPTPSSGLFFKEFQQAMARDRRVICPDATGFGMSYRPERVPALNDYATDIGLALQQLGFGGHEGPVDLLGFHTGAFVACELALLQPDLVRRLVLPGMPFFAGADREAAMARAAVVPPYLEDPAALAELWASKLELTRLGIAKERAFEHMLQDLISAPNGWWGFKSVFSYAAEERLPRVTQAALAIADKGLFEPTVQASRLIPDCELVEAPELTAPVFLVHYERVAALARAFLDRVP